MLAWMWTLTSLAVAATGHQSAVADSGWRSPFYVLFEDFNTI